MNKTNSIHGQLADLVDTGLRRFREGEGLPAARLMALNALRLYADFEEDHHKARRSVEAILSTSEQRGDR